MHFKLDEGVVECELNNVSGDGPVHRSIFEISGFVGMPMVSSSEATKSVFYNSSVECCELRGGRALNGGVGPGNIGIFLFLLLVQISVEISWTNTEEG